MYRYKRGVNADYNRQGYIYFLSRQYAKLSREKQAEILRLCREAGGEYARALFEFVTTDTTAAAICMRHYISKATLYRTVKKYYEEFPKEL